MQHSWRRDESDLLRTRQLIDNDLRLLPTQLGDVTKTGRETGGAESLRLLSSTGGGGGRHTNPDDLKRGNIYKEVGLRTSGGERGAGAGGAGGQLFSVKEGRQLAEALMAHKEARCVCVCVCVCV